MPSDEDQGEWLSSEQFKVPPQTLERDQVDAFLAYIFDDVARKPDRMTLREAAAVARSLEALAIQAGAQQGEKARLFSRLSKTIWGTVFRKAPIQAATQDQVTQFLRRHADTYLAGFDVEAALKWIAATEPSADDQRHFQPPGLVSKRMSVSDNRKASLTDDLSERIYVAYHALRRCRIHNARGRVAAALNARGLETRARPGTSRRWGSYEVNERVRQYEKLRNSQGEGIGSRGVQQRRDALVDRWILLFRTSPNMR